MAEKMRKLNVTVQCLAVYNSSINVPKELSFEDAIKYAREHLDEVPLGTLEYVSGSDELDEENCDIEDESYTAFDIYEEGFCVMEGSGQAHYVGSAEGTDFLDACKNYIAKNPNSGYIKKGNYFGKEYEYACSWGCRWFPTLTEAQASFG